MHTVIDKILQTIRREQLLCAGDTVFVALSGGADSVALLAALIELKDRLALSDIRALHVHHGLRTAADRDEHFVTTLCQSLDIPLSVAHVQVLSEAKKTGESVEEAARRLRYAFFEAETAGFENAKIATAHTADDQAETVLFRLIRGTGVDGICGIPFKRNRIIRPMLTCSSKEVREFCKQSDLPFVIDETNFDCSFSRNRLRHEVMPLLRKINTKATEHIVSFATIAAEENQYIARQAQDLLHTAQIADGLYDIGVLLSAPHVLLRRALLAAVNCFSRAERMHIESIAAVLKDGGTVNLPNGVRAVSDKHTLRFLLPFSDNDNVVPLPTPVVIGVPFSYGSEEYIATILDPKEFFEKIKIHKKLFNFCLSYDMIGNDIFLRPREEGDSLRPWGRHCTKTLKKLFNECRIPTQERHRFPLICNGKAVLAVLGVAVDERYAVTEHTKTVLCIQKISTKGM